MKKIIYNIVFVIYAIIAVFVTICLLSYNEYKITEFGDYSWVLITNDELGQDFNRGDLVIVNKKDDIAVGNKIFFYNTYDKNLEVNYATVKSEEKVTDSQTTYTIEGDYQISSSYVLGSATNATAVGTVGTILSVLESKWGFLFLIILPALIVFIYEIIKIITEIVKSRKKEG